MTVEEAIQLHGAMAVFEAGTAGECENYAPLQALGLNIETIEEAEQISTATYDRLTVEEKAALYWEASQDLYKPTTRMPEELPTSREEQVALIESWVIMEQLRRGDLVG